MHKAWRWLIVFLVLAGGATVFLPVRIDPVGPTAPATLSLRSTGHPVLLVIDTIALGQSPSPDAWPDLEWQNILTQGYGSCDIAELAGLADESADRELIVVPRRTAEHLGADSIEVLRSQVEAGCTVLFEAPDSACCQLLGLDLGAIERPRQLPWPQPRIATGDLTPVLRPRSIQLEWTRYRYAPALHSPAGRPEVRLSLDGRPLGWVVEQGAGAWAALAMDFGELAHRLRQGGAVRARTPGSVALAASDDAWLDAWIEGVLGAVWSSLPVMRVSVSPIGSDGWLLVGTEATEVDTPDWVTRFVRADVAGADPDADGLTGWPPRPESWSTLPPVLRRTGALGLTESVLDLGSQRQRAAPRARVFRTGEAFRAHDADLTFASLAGAGFAVDASQTPPRAGWAFGSGVPFAPLDESGRVFAIQEVPVHALADADSLDLDRIDRWMRHNGRGGASPIQVQLRGDDPASTLRELEALALRRQHQPTRVADLVSWWSLRSTVRVRVRADGADVVATISGLSRLTEPAGLALLVPVRWGQRSLAGWEADWGLPRSRRVQRFDRGYRLIEIGPAAESGQLRLRYR